MIHCTIESLFEDQSLIHQNTTAQVQLAIQAILPWSNLCCSRAAAVAFAAGLSLIRHRSFCMGLGQLMSLTAGIGGSFALNTFGLVLMLQPLSPALLPCGRLGWVDRHQCLSA